MIDKALGFLTRELNGNLKRVFHLSEDRAILGNIVDESGGVPEKNKNKILITLIHLEEESNKPFLPNARGVVGGDIQRAIPLNFNMHILVSSNFSDYNEALKFLAQVVNFFKAISIFSRQNSPGIDSGIEKLLIQMENLNYQETQNIWAALGAKMLPSVVFKVGMISLLENQIEKISTSVISKSPE